MTSSLVAPFASLEGSQEPRISSWPAYSTSAIEEVLGVCALAGIELDPWQQFQLAHGLGESPHWKCPKCVHRAPEYIRCPKHPGEALVHPWAAFEVASIVPRQNGKSELLIARMLGGLFVLEEPLQIYSAHLFDTAMEVMRRLIFVVENTDDLRKEVKHRGSRMVGIKYSHGEEGVELQNGLRVRFKARTGGGGRGFSCDCLYLDEAMILPESFLGATVPTLSARANPQIWIAGSAPDQYDPTHDGVVLSKRRARALAGGDASLAYFEHSAEGDSPDTVGREVLDDPEQWSFANPGLGIRISGDYVSSERRAMGARQFAVERLGIGDWPDVEEGAEQIISGQDWDALADPASRVDGSVCFAYDVTPDRSMAAIAMAGLREDGHLHVEVVDHRRGTGWIADRLSELTGSHDSLGVCCDGAGPAGALIGDIRGQDMQVLTVTANEHSRACAVLFDAVEQGTFRHHGTAELDEAIRGADTRPLGDSWAWSRKNSSVDISPLVASTLALGAAAGVMAPEYAIF